MPSLSDCCVLIVEDEPLLALDVESVCVDAGFQVAGPFASVPSALLELGRQMPDMAILDINVAGELIFPVICALQKADVPYVILSGHSWEMVPESLRGDFFIAKPYQPAELLRTLRGMLANQDCVTIAKSA